MVALSKDKGIVALQTHERSLDQWKFVDFLKELTKQYNKRHIGLYIDNASFHKAKSVTKYARDNNIELIFSPVYSP